MKLIVGLGNPGRQYVRTPHNVGFDVVNLLASRHWGRWALERRFDSETCEITLSGRRVTLMKPLTYMNLSGRAVAAHVSKNGGEPSEILVVSDDIHLPLGQLRLRPSGSHGGHKGLVSLIQSLGSTEFPRVRIGVQPPDRVPDGWVDYVLGSLRPADREAIEKAEAEAANAIETILEKGISAAMNQYNRKRGDGKPDPQKGES